MTRRSETFLFGKSTPKETVGEGITRQILGYGENLLIARVEFGVGAVGEVHSHTHAQASYVESGEFDVYIDGVEKRLGPGDSFYVEPDLDHGAVCRKAGVLLDVFSPVRKDFFEDY